MTNKALREEIPNVHILISDGHYQLAAEKLAQAALASSGNEAPGDDKGLVERVARALFDDQWLDDDSATRIAWEDASHIEQSAWARSARAAITALSSGNEVAKVVGWLREEAQKCSAFGDKRFITEGFAQAIERGDHLASDAAPLTGGGENG